MPKDETEQTAVSNKLVYAIISLSSLAIGTVGTIGTEPLWRGKEGARYVSTETTEQTAQRAIDKIRLEMIQAQMDRFERRMDAIDAKFDLLIQSLSRDSYSKK